MYFSQIFWKSTLGSFRNRNEEDDTGSRQTFQFLSVCVTASKNWESALLIEFITAITSIATFYGYPTTPIGHSSFQQLMDRQKFCHGNQFYCPLPLKETDASNFNN